YDALADIGFIDPGLDGEVACRKMLETIAPGGIGFLKIGRIQNQYRAAHAIVDFAMHRDDAGLIKRYLARFLLFTVTTKVEALGLRVRKDIVIGVVQIWKFHRAARAYRNQVGREQHVLLRHL